MPNTRNKLRRMCLVYSILMESTEKKLFYNRYDIAKRVEKRTGETISVSSIEKDMQDLYWEFDIEINFIKVKGGYFLPNPPSREEFKEQILIYLNIEL